MAPVDILKHLRKQTVEWATDPDFLRTGEIPFFDVGDDIVLVFRDDDLFRGAVYEQHGEAPRITSFEEFLELLYEDVNLYRSSHFDT